MKRLERADGCFTPGSSRVLMRDVQNLICAQPDWREVSPLVPLRDLCFHPICSIRNMGVIRIPKLRCAPGALLALLLLLPEIEMGAQSGDPTFSDANWSSLGAGVNGSVVALVASGKDLYAGGTFRTAGGISANYIAKWDGSSWTALGSGVSGNVLALAVSGNEVYAGGRFTKAGGSAGNYIATTAPTSP